MLPFDYCCASVKKELKKRICQVCNQYIPSAYRMKNHYKIHAQHYEDFDHDQHDMLPPPSLSTLTLTDDTKDSEKHQAITAKSSTVKLEILDWLRPDLE